MKKQLYAFHGWLGLNFGLVLFIICLSGTVAVVSHEIDWLFTPAMRVTPGSTRVSYDAMYEAVRRNHPEAAIQSLWIMPGSRFAYQFWIKPPQGGRTVRVFVDPYTGQVQGTSSWFNTQRFFRDFHRRFFCFSWWGIWLVAAYAVPLLGSAATGLMFYKRWWAKLFILRPHKGGRVFWSDLHRFAGVWTFVFALLIAITGIWYFVEIPLAWSKLPPSPRPPRIPQTSLALADSNGRRVTIDDWVLLARKEIPGLEVRSIRFPVRPKNPVYIDGQAEAWLVRDRANKVLIDPYAGKVLFAQRGEEAAPFARWADTADPLHFGDFGGLTSKLIWVIFGLALSALMPTGVYLWVRRSDQMAIGAMKKLRHAETDEAQIRREVRQLIRRRTGLGLLSTSVILLLAAYATFDALRDQWPTTADADPSWSLGGYGAIAVYGTFTSFIFAVIVVWYRLLWFPRDPTRFGSASPTEARRRSEQPSEFQSSRAGDV